MNETIKKKLEILPEKPGCYLYKDRYGEIIYVGKAKVLKNRVKSYFTGTHNKKTQNLVSKIEELEFIIVSTEKEALILENNLIKKYRPYYNIRLKDDKSYPYIMISKEEHPRISLVRKFKKNSKNLYFGPYVDIKAANNLKKIIDKIYPLRKCNPVEKRPCTYYQIGECIGPCAKNIDFIEYKERISKIKSFLSGNTKKIVEDLHILMQDYVNKLEFESAATIHEYIKSINLSLEKQVISSNNSTDIDYVGYYYNNSYLCVQMFLSRFGSIIERKVEYFPIYDNFEEVLITYLNQYYSLNKAPETVYIDGLDAEFLSELFDMSVINPKKGVHLNILETLKKNAQYFLENEIVLVEEKEKKHIAMLENIAKKLGVLSISSIDIFDNSNIMGRDAVSVKVNFFNGKKNTYAYRKYKVKYTDGINDIATMQEVLYRTYKNKDSNVNLIIVDGGINHVKAAIEIIHDKLELDIKIIGLAKNEKHITEYIVTDDFEKIILEKNSDEYLFFKRIQDEVHRFAITYHRQLKTNNMFNTELDKIKGIGKERKKILLSNFDSIEDIKNASEEKLISLSIPKSVIEELKKFLK